MANSWHLRPIAGHQLCPVCAVPHYPFCPRSSAFAGDNLRFFRSDIGPTHFDRPLYDPSHHRPFPVPPSSRSAPFQLPFQSTFLHEDVSERESFRKRMRMEDAAVGMFPPFEPFDRTLSVEDERRLNLIRSHGRQGFTQEKGGYHRNTSSEYRMDQHSYDAEHKHFSSPGIDCTFQESEYDHRTNIYSHVNAQEGYQNQQISCLDRRDRFMLPEKRDLRCMEFKSDCIGVFDPQNGDCCPFDTSTQLDKVSHVPRLHRSDEAFVRSEDFLCSAPWKSFLNDSFRPTSYFTIHGNPLGIENSHDQQKYHSVLGTSPLLTADNYHSQPCHQDHAAQNQMERKFEIYSQEEVIRTPFNQRPPNSAEVHRPLDSYAYLDVEQLGLHTCRQANYAPVSAKFNHVMPTSIPEHGHTSLAYPSTPIESFFEDVKHLRATSTPDHGHTSQAFPSIPPQPLFPIQAEQSLSSLPTPSVSATIPIASPVDENTSAKKQLPSQSCQSLPQGELYNEPPLQVSNGIADESSPFIRQSSSKLDERPPSFLVKHTWKEEGAYVDASNLFKQPYRSSRPEHIVIILRGLPGSGKSYLAKALRDIEVENGGSAPRIHAMDDYFMMEVEKKIEDSEGFKSSGSVRSKRQITKKVIEYCYEPDMEEAYRSSMLKAFKKTLEDGIFTLVIVDDRNLRVADFAQFWAIAKRSSYEVYLLEATYKDPVGCAARNIHGFKLADIQEMAKQWEEAPPLYLHLDIQSLFGGDDLFDQSIQEVDMDADDTIADGEAHLIEETKDWNSAELKLSDEESDHGSTEFGKRWNTEDMEAIAEKNNTQRSKWSQDLSVNDSGSAMENTNALSGLIQAYGKGARFVHWGDKVEASGFSIGVNKKQSAASSLIIGPGAGYNLRANPLPEENPAAEEAARTNNNDARRRFSEQLRAERESFRAVFDRRRQRVGGLWDADDE